MKVRGVELALHPEGDYVSDAIRLAGDFYEAAVLDELARRITRAGVLVDVGAMIGNHAAFLAAFVPHREVRAFEPIADNIDLLIRNLAPWTEAYVHPVALSDREQLLRFVVDDKNRGHTRADPVGTVAIPALALDTFGFDDVTLIKIDVEGHELEVLAGARSTIERSHPLLVVEDWPGTLAASMPAGYQLVADWGRAHQTYLYEWAGE